MIPPYVFETYFVLLGLIVGSYLNVLAHRLPRQISSVTPRSRCPRCQAPIRALDNIPVLSYLWLRGRCRHCGMRISWRYPAVELLTGLCFLLSLLLLPNLRETLLGAVFCAAMIVLALIDFEHYLLPDVITKSGIVAGLLLQLGLYLAGPGYWLSWASPLDGLWGALLGGALLLALSWGWYLWKGVEGMGMGDVKMLAMIGAFLGWQGTISTLFIATLSGSLVGGILMLRRRLEMQSKLPFGVFLAFAAVLSLFFGPTLKQAYLELVGLAPR